MNVVPPLGGLALLQHECRILIVHVNIVEVGVEPDMVRELAHDGAVRGYFCGHTIKHQNVVNILVDPPPVGPLAWIYDNLDD